MWSHPGASVGGDKLKAFAGSQYLIVNTKNSLRNTLAEIFRVYIMGQWVH